MSDNSNFDANMLYSLISEAETEKSGQKFDIFRLRHVLRKNLPFLLLLLLISISAAVLYLRYTMKVYESSALLQVNTKSKSGVLGIQSSAGKDNTGNGGTLQRELEIIRSPLIRDEVIEALDIKVSYFQEGQILSEEKYIAPTYRISYDPELGHVPWDQKIDFVILSNTEFEFGLSDGDKIKGQFGKDTYLGKFKFVANLSPSYNSDAIDKSYFFTINSYQYLTSYIQNNLKVSIENKNANTIRVSFKDHNKYKARDIVEQVITLYLDKTLDDKKESHESRLAYINEQITNSKDSLDRADSLLRNFILSSSTFDVKSQYPLLKEKMSELDELLHTKTEQLRFLDSLYSKLNTEDSLGLFISNVRNYGNPEMIALVEELDNLYREFEALKLTTKPSTHVYQKRELELLLHKNSIVQLLINEKGSIVDQVNRLKNQIYSIQQETDSIPNRESAQKKIERDYQLFEKFYTLLFTKRIEYEIMKAGTVQEFDILAHASLPEAPIYPVRFKVYALSIGVWVFLSIGWLFLKYMMQNTIVNQEELERLTSAPILGSVPRYAKVNMEVSQLIVGISPKSVISEAFRSIRTNLDFVTSKRDTKYFSVTSTISGEGKTFISLNLGGVLAMSGQKVVIVDCDMRKPKIHLGFGGYNKDGVSSILIGKKDYIDCLNKCEIDGLHYITAGPIPPNPSELVIRPEFDQLMKDLGAEYDVVILDTPPVGLVTDGVLLMQKVDVPIYVVRSDYTRKGVENNINKLIKFNKVKNLSLVLNSVPKLNSSQYGYGGYGYGYGYGYFDEDEQKSKNIFKRLFGKK